MRSDYKHYCNSKEPGRSTFFTTTILDFVMVFAEPSNADLMAASLLDDLRFYGAELWAFVVMGHHIHLLAVPPESMNASKLMEGVKGRAARRIVPHLPDDLRAKLSVQKGLNKRSMWKVRFRSVPIINKRMFNQKVNYIHANPVRAGLCERAQDFRWSSSWMYHAGKFDWDRGIIIDDELIRFFCDPELLKLGMKPRKPPIHPSTEGDFYDSKDLD